MIGFLLSEEEFFPCISSDINEDSVADYAAHGLGPGKYKFEPTEI